METFVRKVSLSFLIVLFGVFTLCSLFWTTWFDIDYVEIPKYANDHVIVLLLVFAVVAGLTAHVLTALDKLCITSKRLLLVLLAYGFVFSILWVSVSDSKPMADSNTISIIAGEFARGIYNGFLPGAYLYGFTHQIGYTAYVELFYRIFGVNHYQAVQFFNSFWICLTLLSLYQVTALTFKNERILKLMVLEMFFCLPLYFYSVFVYGNIPALALSVFAMWMLLRYFEKDRLRYFFAAGIAVGSAVLLKSNSLIFLIAMGILLVVHQWKQKEKWKLVLLIVLLLLSRLPGLIVNWQYELRSGMEVGKHGLPKTTWIAMGMQEGKWAPGWYNDFPLDTYIACQYDEEAVGEIALSSIRESAEQFIKNPAYALRFYGKKFVSQWNEPSYQCYMVGHEAEETRTRLANSFYYNTLHRVTLAGMNVYQFVVMAGAFACFLLKRKQLTLPELFMGIVIIGGVLFHLLWEAKCQYALAYFVLMVPYGAAGLEAFTSLGKNGILGK